MMLFASVVVICLTICWIAWRAERMFREYLARLQAKPVALEPMPSDVITWAQTFGDRWAQEAALKRAEELYRDLGDWARVRVLLEGEGQ